jgi:hypothetical protein
MIAGEVQLLAQLRVSRLTNNRNRRSQALDATGRVFELSHNGLN